MAGRGHLYELKTGGDISTWRGGGNVSLQISERSSGARLAGCVVSGVLLLLLLLLRTIRRR